MESGKKWVTEHNVKSKKNGIYVHYSPPKVLGANTPAQLRQWARGGDTGKLERAVLAGQGRRVLHEARAQLLAQHLEPLYHKCEALHASVEQGSLLQLQAELENEFNKRKFIMCRDEAGVGLLHKAVYYGFLDIAEWLVKNFPALVHQRDSEGRTPLHYASACREEAQAAALLEGAGASRSARDEAGHTPAYYRGVGRPELALPTVKTPAMARENKKNPTGLVIKRSNIRIWCHDCDMGKLQRIVWEGHGTMLLREVSNQPVVKRFLEAVPYIMNTIRDIHYSVVHNDLEGLMKHAGDPVPPQALSCRDGHNLTVTHKAAGLGHVAILKYITNRYPQGLNDIDNDGRTPLHYAASSKDDMHAYNTLVFLGADESILDNKNKTAAFYIGRPQEIDKSVLKMLPDAPRTPSSVYPSTWDWSLLDTNTAVEYNKKSKRRTFKSSENVSNYNNTEKGTHYGGMKQSSTHEYISDMSGFNDPITKSKSNEHIARNQDPDTDENNEIAHGDDHVENEQQDDHVENEQQDNHTEEEEAVAKVDEIDKLTNGEEQLLNGTDNNTESTDEINEPSDDMLVEANNNTKELGEEEENESKEEESTVDIENEGQDLTADKAFENLESDSGLTTIENPPDEDEIKKDSEVEIEQENDTLPDNDAVVHEIVEINDANEDTHPIESNTIQEHAVVEEKQSRESKDDEDVYVQGENQSEYSEINQRSTAEASDGSAKRGNSTSRRNTQESMIEGIVKEENEMDSQDAGVVQSDKTIGEEALDGENEIDPEVADLVNTANMEMLAALVLNGEGSRLIGRVTHNFEVQAFLDNVPTYMKKIQRVHLAAREGNIRELQAALDRRKFAIARDPVSPNGATPLHVATVFGKTNIIKYLGGRFPETLSAVDFEGRTALHYAAVLPDNGHYYNLLQQLGANSKDLDDNGRSADEYHKNPSLLSFHQLASDFGLNEDAMQTMLADRGSSNTTAPSTTNTNGHMDIPIFRTEEGRYLAKSLGDPLIKGLTEVANVKPKDPVAFLASFLHNFPAQEKPRLGTQETKIMITKGAPEVENEQAPPGLPDSEDAKMGGNPRPFDVIAVEPQYEEPNDPSQDTPEAAFSSADRDEHGQSMLHFAAARTHTRNALFDLLQESDINLGFRDELYRTARDVSIQANVPENTAEIDRWVLQLAARGKTDKLMELLLEGYDHIMDVVDDEGVSIQEVISQRGLTNIASFLESIPPFEESRESLHNAIRRGDLSTVKEMVGNESGRTLARAKNSFSRSALHVAVLAQNEEIVAYLAKQFPELLRLGDNIERTPLHYAMGVDKIESLSRLLIKAGAKRVLKDLKGRQPSYYFMNKSDILRLKEEEEVY